MGWLLRFLRDYVVGKALDALLAGNYSEVKPTPWKLIQDLDNPVYRRQLLNDPETSQWALNWYRYADAQLRAHPGRRPNHPSR